MNILRNLTILLISALLVACAATKPAKVRKEKVGEKSKGIIEDLDPLTFTDDDFVIEVTPSEVSGLQKARADTSVARAGKDTTGLKTVVKVPGYRIQIAALEDQGKAMEIQKEAMLKFTEDVYLIFDSPYYKIRVGNCVTRREAEELQKKAVRLGFLDAWIIRTMVEKRE